MGNRAKLKITLII